MGSRRRRGSFFSFSLLFLIFFLTILLAAGTAIYKMAQKSHRAWSEKKHENLHVCVSSSGLPSPFVCNVGVICPVSGEEGCLPKQCHHRHPLRKLLSPLLDSIGSIERTGNDEDVPLSWKSFVLTLHASYPD